MRTKDSRTVLRGLGGSNAPRLPGALAEWNRQYEAGEKPTAFKLKKQFNQIRRDQYPWTWEVTKNASDQPFLDLGKAFTAFFEGKARRPRFKSKKRSKPSFSLANDQCELGDHRLWVPKLGWVNMAENLRFLGKITGARITKTADWWFVSIQVEMPDAVPVKRPAAVGIDVGLNRLATLSTGDHDAQRSRLWVPESLMPLLSVSARSRSQCWPEYPAGSPSLDRADEDAEHWYLVIDYFPGETLESRLNARSRALPFVEPTRARVKEVLRCGLSLCEVLTYLHTRTPPVIFRDLKPSNIICISQEKYALIDFGIARTFKPGQEKDTLPLGSPGYAAPEQYGKAQTDARADIYSLGAVLHQMLTGIDPGEQPFSFTMPGYTNLALCRLESLLLKMVALKREERPGSASQVEQELHAIEEVYERTDTRIWIPQPGQTPPVFTADGSHGAGQFQLQIQYPLTPYQRRKQARAGKRPVSRRKLLVGGTLAGGPLLGGGGLLTNWLIQTLSNPRVTWSPASSSSEQGAVAGLRDLKEHTFWITPAQQRPLPAFLSV